MKEALLGLLVKEPAHGYELRARLSSALGPLGDTVSPGQVYVTLSRLEKVGHVAGRRVSQSSSPDKTVYEATSSGREAVADWLMEASWGKVAPVDFYMKLVAAEATRLADPLALIDGQRRELLRLLRDVQREADVAPPTAGSRVLLEGAAMRLQSDIRWLEVCERHWTTNTRHEDRT